MSYSAKEKLESLQRRLLQREKEFQGKRSVLEQSLKSLAEILNRTGWNYTALAIKSEELEKTLERQREECDRTEKKLKTVASYIKRREKNDASLEDIDKEYELWKEFERPSLESDIEVACRFLEEQPNLKKPSEKAEIRKVPEEIKTGHKEEAEALTKKLEQKKQKIQEVQEKLKSLTAELDTKEEELKGKANSEKIMEKIREKFRCEAEGLTKNLEQRKQEIKEVEQDLEQKKKELKSKEEKFKEEMEEGLARQKAEAEKSLLELKAKYKVEEEGMIRNLKKKEQEIIETEEKSKEELAARMAQKMANAEKAFSEVRSRYREEEAAMAQNIKMKEEALRGKFMAWARAQKQGVEKELEALKEHGKRSAPEVSQKEKLPTPIQPKPPEEKVRPAAVEAKLSPDPGEEKAPEEKKLATVTPLPIKSKPPAFPPRENTDCQGEQRVFLADRYVEVKLKGIIEMGLLYDLTEHEIGVLVKSGNEAMRPGNTLPGVMFHIPDSVPVGGRAEVKDIRPNPDKEYEHKILLTVSTPDLADSQRKDLLQFVEKSKIKSFKEKFLKVENDF